MPLFIFFSLAIINILYVFKVLIKLTTISETTLIVKNQKNFNGKNGYDWQKNRPIIIKRINSLLRSETVKYFFL